MTKFETKFIEFIKKHIDVLFLIAILFLSMVIRYTGRKFVSGDMRTFLFPWFDIIKNSGGLKALKSQVGDYNLLYQTIISLFTYIGNNSMYYYKILSIMFDFIMAIVAGVFVCELKGKNSKKMYIITISLVLMLPTVILNSAFWGQCDSIYTTFILLTLLCLYKEKYLKSFIFLGVAFAFKFQTILIVPFIICFYLYKKRFSIFYFFVTVFVFWASGIVAYMQGRNILEPFKLYMNQTSTYQCMYINFPSIWQLIGSDYEYLKDFGVFLALFFCGLGVYVILKNNVDCHKNENYIAIASWFVWACLLFLPSMHERYAYVLDIMLLILSCINFKYIKYFLIANGTSLLAYGDYLFHNSVNYKIVTIVYVIAFIYYTYAISINNSKEKRIVNL